jgi:hypothetical protein
MTTKTQLRDAYIARLQATYDWYVDGSRPLALAHAAVTEALSGGLKLDGLCWNQALRECGLSTFITRKALSELPE